MTSPIYRQRPSAQKTPAQAIYDTLISPNEADTNLEPANVVDGLFEVARAIQRVADALDRLAERL